MSMSHVELDNSSLAFIPGTQNLSGFDRPFRSEQTPLEFKSARKGLKWHVTDKAVELG